MIGYYCFYYGETETGSGFFGRKIGLKELRLYLYGYAYAIIGDLDVRKLHSFIIIRLYDYLAAVLI